MKAVLFDLDGTLLDPNGSIRETINLVVEEAGYARFTDKDILIGMPLRDILRLRTNDADEREAMVHRYREVFLETTWKLVRPYDGIMDLVARLDVPRAIVTTKGEGEAKQLLENLDHAKHFDIIIGDDDVRPVKPDPAPVQAACGELGLLPRDAIMVGDTTYDIHAGNTAGCKTIGVLWGHGRRHLHEEAGADAVVGSVAELEQTLRSWL